MRCADFYEKWKKDPNWCEKSPDAVKQIDHYLELVTEIEAEGVEPAAIYKKFPESVAREVLKIKDEATRKTVLHNAAGTIKRGEKVSRSDILVWAGIEKPSPEKLRNPTIVGSSTSGADVKKKDPKPIRCMYLSRDETRCHAPDEYQEKCTEEVRKNRNCPIPINVPQPRRLSDDLNGVHDTPGSEDGGQESSDAPINNRRAIIPQASMQDLKKYTVSAGRFAQSAIRQTVHNKIADTEDQAVQRAFDLGIEKLLEENEKKIQEEEVQDDESE